MKIADRILQNQDRDGMLRRSLERIIQLYTDKSHFVYELLQNAEDAEATSIRFVQYSDRLEVMHDGKSFTTENLRGLCDIGQSDKVNDLNQIGEFGVGFKSVFGICETVQLYSAPRENELSDNCYPFSVEIKDFTIPIDITPAAIPSGYTTLFVFPYKVGLQFSGFKTIDALSEAITTRLKNLGVTTLLFMRHLNLIEYEIKIDGKEASGEYLLDTEIINDHCTRVSAVESEDEKTDESLSFIKFSMPLDSDAPSRTIDIAFTISKDKDGKTSFVKAKNPYISVYFPTETESKLDFIIQGPFRTTPNRSSVPYDEEENQALAEKAAKLLRQSVLELCDNGLLDLSFIKILPINYDAFNIYPLFLPLYKEIQDLLSCANVLPTKDGTGYTNAFRAIIARSKELAELLPSDLISELINDGRHYEWLPVSLTETGPYKDVHSYFSNVLGISVLRPEDLKPYFNKNSSFLEARDNDWLVKLYKLYETIPTKFSETASGNMLDAVIVRTASECIVAPYRKSTRSYIANVFLPSSKTMLQGVEYVHPYLYERCRSFFENVLHLKAPDPYEQFTKSLERRYSGSSYEGSFDEHVQDVGNIARYIKSIDYDDDLKRILKNAFYLKCRSENGDCWLRPYSTVIRFPVSKTGLMLEQYYKGIAPDVFFVDYETYKSKGVTYDDLHSLGVIDNITLNNDKTGGLQTGDYGRQTAWSTYGDFRWKLSIDRVEEALRYITGHAESGDAIVKSQVIFKILQENIAKLSGDVYFGGKTQNRHDEPAEIIHILNKTGYNSKLAGWNGKWLYTKSMELVSHKDISKYDLNTAVYGNVIPDTNLYELIGFKKDEQDQHEAFVKDYNALSKEKKQFFFETELKNRFNITLEQLSREYVSFSHWRDSNTQYEGVQTEVDDFEFPTAPVKNWDALRKHAAQILSYASPTVYAPVVRSVRVSRNNDDVRAYLKNMYRINSSNRYACQLCHKPFSNSMEMSQLEQKPDVELDPMNICLCPNCAARFRMLRNDEYKFNQLIKAILDTSETDIDVNDHVSVSVGDYDLWFTPVHIAEIIELIKLKKKANEKDNATSQKETKGTNDGPSSDVRAYKELIGKKVYHSPSNSYAYVIQCENNWVYLRFETGERAGDIVKYDLNMCLKNNYITVVG